jgi:hypothetical protein
MNDPVKEIIEVLRSDPTLLHALLFNPEAIVSRLTSREAKALAYGIDPEAFIRSLSRRAVADGGCGGTCGADSCDYTCGARSCNHFTCSSSCGDTCRHSCVETTQLR